MTSNLKAHKRVEGQSNKKLRKSGQVPCSMYGKNVEATEIQIPQQMLWKALKEGSPKVNIEFEGQTYLGSIEEVQKETTGNNLIHVSFHAFDANEKVSMDIPVHFNGKAIGQTDGGVLQYTTQTVTVYGPANALPESIELDVSQLELGSSIHIADLPSSSQWEIKDNADKVLVSCNYPKLQPVEEPTVEVEAVVEADAPEAGEQVEEPAAEKQAA